MATLTFTQFLSSAKLKRKGLLFKVPQNEALELNNMQPHKEQMHAASLPTKKKKDEQTAQALFYEHPSTFL